MLLLALLAYWPVWQWYGGRMLDGSDDPWGAAALLLVLVLWIASRHERNLNRTQQQRFIALSLIYVIAFPTLPDLARAILALSALAVLLLDGRRGDLALFGLLLLSLPLIASLEFFLGYPVRLVLAQVASFILRSIAQLNVTADGTLLNLDGRLVSIDTPCSGIKMLWVGLFACMGWSAWLKLDVRGTLRSLWFALRVIFVANLTRVLVLFFKESGLAPLPEWTHTGLGIVLFLAAVLLISKRTARLAYAH